MNFATRCRFEFDGITRSRGAEYADNGAVQIVDLDDEGLLADVEGSASEPYEVELDWSDAHSGTLSVSCSCPRFADGILCKHLWAAILSVDSRGQDHRVPGRHTLSIQFADIGPGRIRRLRDEDDAVDDDSNDIAGFLGFNDALRAFRQKLRLAARHASRPPSSSKSSKPVGWKKAFQTLDHSELSQAARDPWDHFQRRDRVAWYLLHVGCSASEGHVIIDLMQQERMKNGELGKVKSLSFQDHMADEFDDPADRQLLQQLQATFSRYVRLSRQLLSHGSPIQPVTDSGFASGIRCRVATSRRVGTVRLDAGCITTY